MSVQSLSKSVHSFFYKHINRFNTDHFESAKSDNAFTSSVLGGSDAGSSLVPIVLDQ
jgi:hypothetical protein